MDAMPWSSLDNSFFFFSFFQITFIIFPFPDASRTLKCILIMKKFKQNTFRYVSFHFCLKFIKPFQYIYMGIFSIQKSCLPLYLYYKFYNICSSDTSIINSLDLHFLSFLALIFHLIFILFSFSRDSSKTSYIFILHY